jgi:nanoRNase/pAp phosphatase (c-di-AMP/oligoRNAs hydrolase)
MDAQVLSQTRELLEQLRAALPPRGRVLVIPHDYPDPDALASAAAMELLLARHFHLRGQIVFSGEVSRAENRELMRHFRYRWRLLGQVRPAQGRVAGVLIDTAPWSRNVTLPGWVRPVAVIDHHAVTTRRLPKGLFLDLRPGTGAAASILTEYLVAADINPPKWLASIMAYAIATETLDLSRDSTPRDMAAYTELLPRANFDTLGRIRHAPLPRGYYLRLQEAMQNARTFGSVAWTHLNRPGQPEILAEIADLLERMERITWSFCTGYVEDRLLVSLRSGLPHARCGSLLKSVIGKDGSAGGHQRMAAGSIGLAGSSEEDRENRREKLVKDLLGRITCRPGSFQESLGLVTQPLADEQRA